MTLLVVVALLAASVAVCFLALWAMGDQAAWVESHSEGGIPRCDLCKSVFDDVPAFLAHRHYEAKP